MAQDTNGPAGLSTRVHVGSDCAGSNVIPAGSRSPTSVATASDGPALVTTRLKPATAPAATSAASGILVIARSPTGDEVLGVLRGRRRRDRATSRSPCWSPSRGRRVRSCR